jgi:FMN phosphatase YigB (HAD superfamily)
VSNSPLQIAAFDVFDTVLTRAVGSPVAVFYLLGRRLSNQGLLNWPPEMFAVTRIQAEARAHDNKRWQSRLEDIYAELLSNEMGVMANARQLADAERSLESDLIRTVPEVAQVISSERNRRRRIVFVSDMYLSNAFIFEQLEKRGLAMSGDGCYVSCEYGKSKRDGGLFKIMLQKESVLAADVEFAGNDPEIDIEPAHKIGVKAQHFRKANLNRYERILDSNCGATGGLASVFAGASRLARLSVAANTPHEESVRDFAASIVAPTLVSFVMWILRYAKHHRLSRLYFLARDGQILHQIAERLSTKLDLPCPLYYLYASRKAWGTASILRCDSEDMSWLLERDPGPDLHRLFLRLGVDIQQFGPSLEHIGLGKQCWNRAFGPRELNIVRSTAFIDLIRHQVLRVAEQNRQVVLRYLDQEGVNRDDNYGLVDVGWHGSLQEALGRICSNAGYGMGTGLFFGLNKYRSEISDGIKEAFFFDNQKRKGVSLYFNELFCLIEMMCAGTEGTCSGFSTCSVSGRVEPILKRPQNTGALEWGLPLLRQTVLSFIDHLCLDSTIVCTDADTRGAVADVLGLFLRTPSMREAEMVAAFPFEGGMDSDTSTLVTAKAYGWNHVMSNLLTGRYRNGSSWDAGSMALTDERARAALRITGRTRSAVKRLLRIRR